MDVRRRVSLNLRKFRTERGLSQEALAPVYRKAAGVLFLISWCEPFGLVAVEAQATGTPLIATRFGALPEIIVEGETGFVVDSLDAAVLATEKLEAIPGLPQPFSAIAVS